MGLLTCQCLNISVHYKGPSWDGRPVLANDLLPDGAKELKKDRLAGETLWEIELDVAGVTAEQRGLVVTRVLGDWVIHTCSNCDTDVYMVHSVKEEGRTFVTKFVVSNPSEMQALTWHEDYSPVFKVLLQQKEEVEEEESFGRKRLSSMTFGQEDPVMKVVHSRMKSFLNQEEENMERRIRDYESEQRKTYCQLQKRAHRDRALLFSAIARARVNVISDAMGDGPRARPSYPVRSLPPHPRMTSPKQARGRAGGGRRGEGERVSPEQHKVTVTVKDTAVVPKRALISSLPPTDDAMFALDGFGEESYEENDGGDIDGAGVAFPQSDDEEISTDDSSFRDVSSLNAAGMAYSMPVGIPTFLRESSTAQEPESPSDNQFDPTDVCNSIKALALSVQDTGMFGDLPKPRKSSAPYAR